MTRLYDIEWGYLPLQLLPPGLPSSENVFTLVVGRNGLGKSRLLADICREKMIQFDASDASRGLPIGVPKVIAVSTGVFDRFPSSTRRFDARSVPRVSNYTYLGVRREIGASSGVMALLSGAVKGLLRQMEQEANLSPIAHTLETIGCESYVRMVFKPSFRSIGFTKEFSFKGQLSADGARLCEYLSDIDPRLLSDFELRDPKSRANILSAVEQLSTYLEQKSVISIVLDFAAGQVFGTEGRLRQDVTWALRNLLDAGLVRLMDLELHKFEGGALSLRRASSGEQCLLTIILGIAGHIEDGATVLIDEPEISLHPEWQERFMELLVSSVARFSGCQFIIATHSPQLVSRVPSWGCFILSLSDRKLRDGAALANKSADVQLAELFDAPGAKNEYLARLAFNLLAQIRASRTVTVEQRGELKHLRDLASRVSRDEPIVELVRSVLEVANFYAAD